MKDIFEHGLKLQYSRFKEADEFHKWIRDAIYKCDVVTLRDILVKSKRLVSDKWRIASLKSGYARKDIRKVKPIKTNDGYLLMLPPPKKIVRNPEGGFTTDDTEGGFIFYGEYCNHAGLCEQAVRRELATDGGANAGQSDSFDILQNDRQGDCEPEKQE